MHDEWAKTKVWPFAPASRSSMLGLFFVKRWGYEITEKGIVVGDALTNYRGILMGSAQPIKTSRKQRR